jgi:hypothetical protein
MHERKTQILRYFFGQHLKQIFLLFLSNCYPYLSSCTGRNTWVYTVTTLRDGRQKESEFDAWHNQEYF